MGSIDVLCVVPPFTYGNYADIGSKCPNLGIATIAAYLEREAYKVRILDAFALDMTQEQIKGKIREYSPAVLFTGSVTATHKAALKIMESAKEIDSSVATVIGGPHPTNAPESCFPQADYVVVNEGEETALELSNFLIHGKGSDARKIKGLAFSKKGAVVRTEKRPFIKDLDQLPMPAYHLLPMDAYKAYGWLDVGRRFSSMVTSRGCPFRCSFCASSKNFEHWWRFRSAPHVFEEMALLYEKYNIRHIYFQDDEFCVHPFRVRDLCRMMNDYCMDMYWECLTRVVSVTDEMLRTMSQAGCKSILYGIETGYEEGWKKIGKPITKDQCRKAIALTKKHNIMVKATFITGFPWEGAAEIKQTIRFAKELNPDIAFFTALTPYVGSYIWEQHYRDDPSLFVGGSSDMDQYIFHGAEPTIRTKHLTAQELEYWNGRAYLEYYTRPTYILNRIKSIRNFSDFRRNLRSGKSLLKLAVKRVFQGQLRERPNGAAVTTDAQCD